jgi:hypothetical protein
MHVARPRLPAFSTAVARPGPTCLVRKRIQTSDVGENRRIFRMSLHCGLCYGK